MLACGLFVAAPRAFGQQFTRQLAVVTKIEPFGNGLFSVRMDIVSARHVANQESYSCQFCMSGDMPVRRQLRTGQVVAATAIDLKVDDRVLVSGFGSPSGGVATKLTILPLEKR